MYVCRRSIIYVVFMCNPISSRTLDMIRPWAKPFMYLPDLLFYQTELPTFISLRTT